jgi:hypothetical protein
MITFILSIHKIKLNAISKILFLKKKIIILSIISITYLSGLQENGYLTDILFFAASIDSGPIYVPGPT